MGESQLLSDASRDRTGNIDHRQEGRIPMPRLWVHCQLGDERMTGEKKMTGKIEQKKAPTVSVNSFAKEISSEYPDLSDNEVEVLASMRYDQYEFKQLQEREKQEFKLRNTEKAQEGLADEIVRRLFMMLTHYFEPVGDDK